MSPEGGEMSSSKEGGMVFEPIYGPLLHLLHFQRKDATPVTLKKGIVESLQFCLSILLFRKKLWQGKVYVKLLRPYLFNEILKEK
jgi:hypothetical protein